MSRDIWQPTGRTVQDVGLSLLLLIGASTADLLTPLGVATGVLYVLPIVATLKLNSSQTTWIFAVISTLLIFMGWWQSPIGGNVWKVSVNRIISILAVWMTAFIVTRGIRTSLLQVLHRRNELLLTCAGEGIFGLDIEGKATFVNPIAAQMLGYSPEELLGSPMHATIHPTKPDGSPCQGEGCPMSAAFMDGAVHHLDDEVLRRKDGTSFPVEYTSTPIRNEQGTIEGAVVTFLDITEPQKRRDEINRLSERLQIATQSGHIGIWDWDVINDVLTWDDTMYALYGISADTYSEDYEAWIQSLHPDDAAQARAETQEALKGNSLYNTHFRIMWPDHSIHYIRAFAHVIRNAEGRPIRMTGVNVDITDQKHIERELLQQRAALARSNRELQRFAYMASHDLQEPLRMISSFIQLLATEYNGRLDAEAHEYIGYVVDGAVRMRTLIDGLLEYSQLGNIEQTFNSTDCESLLNEALLNLGEAIAEKQAVVTHDPLPTVLANGNQLAQVFQNLISNGLKFSGPQSPIIHVGAVRQEEAWQFSVADNGIGIEPAYREQIFDMFQRLNQKSEYPGSGIGLSICHKIIGQHRGKIWVDSEFGVGSTFYFTIPHK
ncbi:PAS domain-containing protein [Nitrospira sp. M1]